MYHKSKHIVQNSGYLSGIENHYQLIDQLDGNMSIASSIMSRSQCSCCEGPLDCSTTISDDQDYDYEMGNPIPGMMSTNPGLGIRSSQREI